MEVLEPSAGQTQGVRVLNLIIWWTRTGLEYELDQRHAERISSELEVETRKPVSTPCVQENLAKTKMTVIESAEMDDKEARRLRAVAARLHCLAAERPDLLFSSKCICKNMARPRVEDWVVLKRVGRYLQGWTRVVQLFHWTGDDTSVQGYTDSDWAGDGQNMKSTSGGVIMRSGHCKMAWSTSQSALGLCSGEAELYAMTNPNPTLQFEKLTEKALEGGADTSGCNCCGSSQRSNMDNSGWRKFLGKTTWLTP